MPLHAVAVVEATLDFVEQVNGGVRPIPSDAPDILVYSDRVDDDHTNELLTQEEFWDRYMYHECSDPNCNVVDPS